MRLSDKKTIWKISILATIVFYLVAHGYRFSNNMYSHDSLLTLYQNDYGWQIAIGRFVIPALVFLRGSLCSPWLISICGLLWYALSVALIVEILDMKTMPMIILVAGICVCNPTAVAMNAAYLIDVDLYALSMFLSILCVYLWKQSMKKLQEKNIKTCTWYLVASIIAMSVSMGIYQAYICMAVGLFMLLLLKDLQDNTKFFDICKKACIMLLVFLITGLIYYVVWKLFQKIFHIWTSDSYNGLASVGDYSDTSVLSLIGETYRRFFIFFTNPDVFQSLEFRGQSLSFIWKWILRIANLFMLIYIVGTTIYRNHKSKLTMWQKVMQWLLLALFPFGVNIVCFISKGMEHGLMMLALNLVYVLVLWQSEDGWSNAKRWKQIAFILPFAVILWTNIVYANQVYLKKELLDQSAGSLLTRMVSDIEDMDGYVPGETPVAIYGSFELAPHVPELADFEEVICYGMGKSNLSYIELDYSYLRHILNVDMNLVRIESNEEEKVQQIQKMSYYPEKGSIAYVGDMIVVKIADN